MRSDVSLEEGVLLTDMYLYSKEYIYYSRLDRAIACLISRGLVKSKHDGARFKDNRDIQLVRGFREAISTLSDAGYIKLVPHIKIPSIPAATAIIPNDYNPRLSDTYFRLSKKLGEDLERFHEFLEYLTESGIIDNEKTTIKYILKQRDITEVEKEILKGRLTKKSKGWGRREVGKRIVPSKKGLNSVDIFICSASFEDRCTRVSDEIENKAIPEYSFIFVDYETYNVKVQDNLKKLEKKLEKISKEVAIIYCDFNNVEKAVDYFKKKCLEYELQLENKVIFIDISTFTKSLLLDLLAVVDNGRNYITTYYTEVGDYGVHYAFLNARYA
jgi:hypothetical protein